MFIAEVRRHFPALQRIYRGFPVAYFDAPGGTQVPREVVEAMTRYLFHHNANTHWAYPTSAETDAIIVAARQACGDFLNASPNEIVFGANMTTLTFHLARALGRTWSAGDEVIVTELDHHANVAPWRALELDPAPDSSPERAETGTQNQEGIAGIQATIDFLASLSDGKSRRERLGATFRSLHEEGVRLLAKLWKGLASIPRVHLYGPPPSQPRTPTLAFTVERKSAEEVVRALVERGLFLSHGDFYAATVIERLGVEALVRAGCACYTTEDEVERLVEGVRQLV